jgi:hypothetical protein
MLGRVGHRRSGSTPAVSTRRRSSCKGDPARNNPYRTVISQQWLHIVMLYERHATKKPVMLFDIQEERVYAFPSTEFRAELSERSQRFLAQQYQRALATGKMVVFVRDNERKQLVSYSLALPHMPRSATLISGRHLRRE